MSFPSPSGLGDDALDGVAAHVQGTFVSAPVLSDQRVSREPAFNPPGWMPRI